MASRIQNARPILKTYSRQRKRRLVEEEPPLKSRRVELEEETVLESTGSVPLSSSSPPPSTPPIFSDEASSQTPPSSPPPRSPQPNKLPRLSKPTEIGKNPLLERSRNVRSKKPPKAPLVQLKIDLGWQTRKTCKVCGMEYIPSNEEDAVIHKKFHAMNVGGVDMDKSFLESRKAQSLWRNEEGDFILAIERKDSLASRKRATKVLSVVNSELSAVEISDTELWSRRHQSDTTSTSDSTNGEKNWEGSIDRFKAFLYIKGQKCVGLCLAESLKEACAVLPQEDAARGIQQPLSSPISSSSILVSKKPEKAIMGVSRIWTSSSHRKSNIARTLLDCAVDNFLYGMKVPKHLVAFSQPTESGYALARKWFGQESGWHVYVN